MGQFWLFYTAAAFTCSPTMGQPPALTVKVGEKGAVPEIVGDAPARAFRCDYRYQIRSPWSFLPPASCGLPACDPGSLVRASLLQWPPHPETAVREMSEEATGQHQRGTGTQAIDRAVDILIAVGEGPMSLPELVTTVNIPKATCHRIAAALVERGLLQNSGRSGYRLGPLIRQLARRTEG